MNRRIDLMRGVKPGEISRPVRVPRPGEEPRPAANVLSIDEFLQSHRKHLKAG